MKSAAKTAASPSSAKVTPPSRLSDDTFAVKASGTCLGTLKEEDTVECRFSALLPLLEKQSMTDKEIDDALLAARVDPSAKKPSVEAVFHAWLLTLPGH